MKIWISTKKFTVVVETDDDRIIRKAAPMVRKFIGQPVDNLFKWAATFGGLKVESWKVSERTEG